MTKTSTIDLEQAIKNAKERLEQENSKQALAILQDISPDSVTDENKLITIGQLLAQLHENELSYKYLLKAAQINKHNVIQLNTLVQYLLTNSPRVDTEKTIETCRKILQSAIEINPDSADSYIMLAEIEFKSANNPRTIELLSKAISLRPNEPAPYSNIIFSYRLLNRPSEALEYAKKLVKLRPDLATSYQTLGRVQIELGNTDEATFNLQKAIKLDKTLGAAYFDLASIKKYSKNDLPLIQQVENNLQTSMESGKRSYIHFSLGKMYDDCKDWNKAFEHIKSGNLLGKPASEDQTQVYRFKKIRKTYTADFIKKFDGLGNSSEVPVFIVGMPRSGTTLIEQIISSHPEACGAGEQNEIGNIEIELVSSKSLPHYKQELLKNLNKDTIRKYSTQYLNVLSNHSTSAKRIVDKMPDNFLLLGLITILFPNAHIIHSIRNPLDTCLSCYFQPFTYLYWTYDLRWIAKRYHFYRQTMNFWKEVLPEGKIADCSYEQLTSDPETQAKQLIANCGLEWDPKCLNYHQEKKSIITASLWQARQPIYTSSKKRWVPYAHHITELAQGLVEYLSEEDIEELAKQGVKLKKKWHLIWW